ncbi:hypothetical protein K1T71_005282 [Dendrolimus kikuchii]|uniref:Uncharacterized protein n=1 Tax=Dendrolimus kikuchii TaxID=765133 RepID=A0ACC1D712_9NEOP|nr:hypothetical protein K1T71_005282 [Dendrolimus kikuchii]
MTKYMHTHEAVKSTTWVACFKNIGKRTGWEKYTKERVGQNNDSGSAELEINTESDLTKPHNHRQLIPSAWQPSKILPLKEVIGDLAQLCGCVPPSQVICIGNYNKTESFQVDSDEDVQPLKRKCHRIVLSETENNDDEVSRVIADTIGNTATSDTWSNPKGNQRKIIPFTELPGLSTNLCSSMRNAAPTDFFQLMVPDSLFQEIAERTNQFAFNQIAKSG